jgi:probable HAF family extracellular repeat protein
MTRIGPRAANCADFVTPVAINNAGQIVGHCAGRGFLVNPMDANDDGVADTWFQDANGDGINDLVVDLGVQPPTDLNDSGWVIGSSPRPWVLIPRRDSSSGNQIWNEDANGDGVNDRVVTLPLLSGIGGDVASAINKDGVVVGLCSLKPTGWSGRYAVLWRVDAQGRATLTNLGLKWSVANGINAAQQVVGSYNDGHGSSSAFLWQNGVMSDLRNLIQPGAIPSTWPLGADEINDLRMILGSYGATTKQKYYIAVPNSLLP